MMCTDHKVDKESLYCLEDHHIAALIPIVGPQSKFQKRLKLLKPVTPCERTESNVHVHPQVCPSTSKTNDEEEVILSKVKNTMSCVLDKLPDQDDKFNKFLKNKINNLETDKRELVGVFGRTGAGKSSLINVIIEEQDLALWKHQCMYLSDD
ncbi:hypothetical protein F7725_003447 [Dissostichus mawsoni]|uniref:Uncharacterized protein n=1 Tax=Dissostichus mawsoni TaxID=36200 RepID=A0A7J5YC88_DISMA|nr:hypothetical protein F7725_003447 [Dissostichus mawsoni]